MIEIELLADDIIGDGVADDALATIPKFKQKTGGQHVCECLKNNSACFNDN